MEEIQPIIHRTKQFYFAAAVVYFIAAAFLLIIRKYDWTLGIVFGFIASSYNSFRLIKDTFRTLESSNKITALYAFGLRIGIFAILFGIAFLVDWVNEWVMIAAFAVLHIGYYVTLGTSSLNDNLEGN